MPVAACCITVSSFTPQNTSDVSVQVNNECFHICAICGAWLPARKTRYPVLSLAAFTSAVLCRSERKRRCELVFDRGLGTQKNMMFYFCTLPLNTKNTACCVRSKCRATSCRASYKLVVSAWWNIDLKLSWRWLRWWVMVLGCSFSSLLSCFHALKGWGASLLLSLFISTCFMNTESNGEQIHSATMCVCVRPRICSYTSSFECVHVCQLDVWGQTQLKFRPGPSLTPQPLQSRPWLILLSFTFLSEIYYVLPWLVFYGLMTGNRSHHQGQLQLHPLCLCSSKCNLVCCLWDPFGLEFQSSLNLLWL